MSNDLWIDGPDDIANAKMPKRRRKWRAMVRESLTRTYTRIPHDGGLKLAKQAGNALLAVLLALDRAIYEAKGNPVKLTNDLLGRYGISAQSKTRGLRQLAAAGIISFGGQPREAPMVTHHWYTPRGKFKGG
jgi:hypothetical protein